MIHEEKVKRWLNPLRAHTSGMSRDFGAEVGAFKTPVPGLRPFYVDRFSHYDNEPVLVDHFGDLCALPFQDHSLDYIVASHVLEHVANPVEALWECARVTRHGGILYLVVPDRRLTFDHPRPLTTVEHMLQDYERGTTDCDPTHISDFLDGLDWARCSPDSTPAELIVEREELRYLYTRAIGQGEGINIHFHTFERSNTVGLIDAMNIHPDRTAVLELLDSAEQFPEDRGDGLLIVARVRKTLKDRMASLLVRLRLGGDPNRALSPGARQLFWGDPYPGPASAPLSHIDSPRESDLCDPLELIVEGWGHAGALLPIQRIELWIGGRCVGQTSEFFPRPDVNRTFDLPDSVLAGFRLSGRYEGEAQSEVPGELRVFPQGSEVPLLRPHTFRFAGG